MAKKMLVIDDDADLCGLLKDYFEGEGYDFARARSGDEGLEMAASCEYDVVLLDVTLPGRDGLDVLKSLRLRSDVPVIMLTARGGHADSVAGLESGADDYIRKPFNTRELSARIRAVLRRCDGRTEGERDTLSVGDVEMNVKARSVRLGGRNVALTGVEFGILEEFLANAGRVITSERLSANVLGRRYSVYDRSLSVHISNLRRKLGPYPCGDARIKTLRGEGFMYVFPAEPLSSNGQGARCA